VLDTAVASILGLVQHLSEAEHYWFGHHLAGHADILREQLDGATGR